MTSLLATILVGTNCVTFTATSTGIGASTPVEFFLAGKGSDRDYETVFLLDDPVEKLAEALEKGGLPLGKPISQTRCDLWPIGQNVTLTPPPSDFLDSTPPEGIDSFLPICHTGGARDAKGRPEAESEMPKAVFALYDCPQSLLQYGAIFPQELVYGCHLLTNALAKGERRSFTISWSSSPSYRSVDLELRADNATSLLETLKRESSSADLVVRVSFNPEVSIAACTAFANALSVIDSRHIKINGFKSGNLFYRAFLPLVKWRERKERLVQPFEITLDGTGKATAVRIEENWNVEGIDPKLTEHSVTFDEMKNYPQTDTALFFAPKTLPFRAIQDILKKLPKTVRVFYVFGE